MALYFFVEGIAAKSPEYGFFIVWFVLPGLLAAGLLGSYWLLNHGHPTWATLLAAVPAILATLAGLWLFLLLTIRLEILNDRLFLPILTLPKAVATSA